MATITKERLAELLARARATSSAVETATVKPNNLHAEGGLHTGTNAGNQIVNASNHIVKDIKTDIITSEDKYGNVITYNSKQAAFVELATSGKSCILIGAAGTGKTTAMRGVIESLMTNTNTRRLVDASHKHLKVGNPGISISAYTRRATNNIRRNVPRDMQDNCITIHKLLEYKPVYYETINDEGNPVKTMNFEPTRTPFRPLDTGIQTIIIEEASMPSVELFNLILAAISHPVQFIFLGDIQQLPPVFGSAILGYKMLELPTIELTEVYRQALESPIIRLAHRILSGNVIPVTEFPEWNFPQLTIRNWTKKVSADIALLTAAKFFTTCIDANQYDYDDDIILIPFNKAFGTDELNKHIAQHVSRKNNSRTYEVIAGWNKSYYAVGDKVLIDKEDAIITQIIPNDEYIGKIPQPANIYLDRWGHLDRELAGETATDINKDFEDLGDIDFLMDKMASASVDSEAAKERFRVASHIIKYRYTTDVEETEFTISTAGEVNAILMAYAITIHKAQGSEWRKVFLLLHNSHNIMLQRELLYTAVTRAREELYIICEDDSLTKGILSQKIKGNTLAEKAEFFKGAIERRELQSQLPKQ